MTKKKIELKKVIDWRIICTGLVCISGLEAYALSQGINGVLLSSVLVIIAAAIGVAIPTPSILRK